MMVARIRSLAIAYRLEIAWVAFAIANLGAMLALILMDGPHGWETVPFHFIYVSFTVLFGYRMWKRNGTVSHPCGPSTRIRASMAPRFAIAKATHAISSR